MASWGSYKVEQLHHQCEAEEEAVEEEQKRLEELMRLYGLEEKEARAAYHLGLAEELFEELSEEAYRRSGFPSVRGVHAWMHDEMDFGEHFHALEQLAMSLVRKSSWGDGCLFGRSQKEDSPSPNTAAHEQERSRPRFLCEPLLRKTLRQGSARRTLALAG